MCKRQGLTRSPFIRSPLWLRISLLALVALVSPVCSTKLDAQILAKPSSEMMAGLQPFVDHHTLAGAVVLVANKDKVLSLTPIGYADLGAQKKMAPDTLFWIASMSKPMTATALMMLVDEGKVNVDDPVEKYLPEFKGQMYVAEKDENHILLKKPRHPILVRNILSHTSGLAHLSPMEKPAGPGNATYDVLSLADAVHGHAMSSLKFDPDSSFEYSNAGINTAGRIIEVVSKMPYEQFMAERLFKPLGMTDTTFIPTGEQLQRLAKSYMANPEKNGLKERPIHQLSYPLTNPRRAPMPAGGLFSTASDIMKFCQMILNNGVSGGKRYISEAALKAMTSKQTGDANKQNYGFGWSMADGTIGHGGAYKTDMTIDPKLGLITVFLVQQQGDWPNKDGGHILSVIRAKASTFGADTIKDK